ncbi:MAG: ABC transporter ATP-binding protein [Candidatus Eremiobacteraeota bacterium]|nr:ABC transporter ATP-binding protein [Candidatus Eremiobacteraeota bacterium]
MQALLRVLRYIRKYWWYIMTAGICTILLNAFTLLQPQLIKVIMDHVILGKGPDSFRYLNLVIAGFLFLIIVKGIFAYFQGYLLPYGVNQAIRDIRDGIFGHIQFLPLRSIERYRTGDLMVRITNDTENLGNVLGLGLINFVNDCLILVGALGWMIYKDWQMTLLIFLVSPLVVFAVHRFGQYVEKAVRRNQVQMSRIYNTIEESITGIRVIKSFVKENQEIEHFKKQNQTLFHHIMKVIQYKVMQVPVIEFLAALGIAVSIWYGGYQVLQGKFSTGDIFAFWGYMIMATTPLNRISQAYSTIRGCIVSAQRIFEILDVPKEKDEDPSLPAIAPLKGHIRYDSVSFHYAAESPVLRDLSFEIEPGKVLAIVGQSGAGKTTAVHLLTRLYDPCSGKILVDGTDIHKVKLHSYRSQLAVVPQETILFTGTIRDNIAFGNRAASLEEVKAAAEAANAHEFIEKLPHGYDTPVGERGTTLSGGQRQRIAIARAILLNPRILILDEATSSVDSLSEELIQKSLEKLFAGRTTLIIAHRVSTIKRADMIIVIDKGEIVEKGTHDELIGRGGVYTSLYECYFQHKDS